MSEINLDINSSPKALRDLEQSVVWGDIRRRLLASIEARRDMLEKIGEEQEDAMKLVGSLAHIQGELFQIRTLLELPEMLAQQKEQELEDAEK